MACMHTGTCNIHFQTHLLLFFPVNGPTLRINGCGRSSGIAVRILSGIAFATMGSSGTLLSSLKMGLMSNWLNLSL